MDDSIKKNQKQIKIELSEEIAEGIYTNLAMITHSNAEFIIDFIKMMPGVSKARVKSRIILTPQHTKRFLNALQDNISKFEKTHGPIKDLYPGGEIPPINFGGPTAQA